MEAEFTGNFNQNSLDSWSWRYFVLYGEFYTKPILLANLTVSDMKKNFTIYLPHYQIGVYVDIYKIDTFWQGQTFLHTWRGLGCITITAVSQIRSNR